MSSIFLHIFFALIGIAGLYYGAELLVKGGSSIAHKIGVSPLVIGLTLVAFATSSPELVVSVSAALDGNADISLGNIVGSNICNIVLILGLCACITPISVQRQLLRFDAPIMLGASVLLCFFYFTTHGLTRWQGAVLFLGIIIYTVWNVSFSRKEKLNSPSSCTDSGNSGENREFEAGRTIPAWLAVVLVQTGLALLIAGAKAFLESAVFFAQLLHISDAVIGLTVVAIGTSLPELATSVVAAIQKKNDIAIGNILGSNIFNILGILGISALLCPLKDVTLSIVDLGFMLFCAICLLPIMYTGWKISRKEGIFFLLSYCVYTAYLLMQHA